MQQQLLWHAYLECLWLVMHVLERSPADSTFQKCTKCMCSTLASHECLALDLLWHVDPTLLYFAPA